MSRSRYSVALEQLGINRARYQYLRMNGIGPQPPLRRGPRLVMSDDDFKEVIVGHYLVQMWVPPRRLRPIIDTIKAADYQGRWLIDEYWNTVAFTEDRLARMLDAGIAFRYFGPSRWIAKATEKLNVA